MKKAYVDCHRHGQLVASYDWSYGGGIIPGPLPDKDKIIGEAKSQLHTDGISSPPWTEITFKVRYP